MSDTTIFGELVRQARRQKKLSIDGLVSATNEDGGVPVSRATVLRIERCKEYRSRDRIAEGLSRALGVEKDKIARG